MTLPRRQQLWIAAWLCGIALASVVTLRDVAECVRAAEPVRIGSDRAEAVVREHTWVIITGIRVIDPDSLEATIAWNAHKLDTNEDFRLLGYDAFETRAYREGIGRISEVERAKGRKATEALQALIDGSVVVLAESEWKRDAYGRLLIYGRAVQPDGTIVKVEDYMRSHQR